MSAGPSWPERGVLVLVGPTAAGKTALALPLAEALGAEIIAADSRQIYQGLDLGTGKPSNAELARVPHHLVSAAPPERVVSAADFAALAGQVLADLTARGRRALVVGGTGLWVRALVDGLTAGAPPDPEIRAELDKRAQVEGLAALHRELASVDPESAARIPPADRVRILRALEIWRVTGEPPSSARKRPAARVRPSLWLGLERPRAVLYARAEARIDQWLARGWLEEVKGLLAQGVRTDTPAFRALGYPQLARVARGEWTLDQAETAIKQDTRHYIKRQLTWFRAEPRIRWFDAGAGEDAFVRGVLEHLSAQSWPV